MWIRGLEMIRSITIENLRGVARGSVEGLSQVSILLGKNGSGKSTVLEAIYIASSWVSSSDPIYDVKRLDYVISRRGGSGNWNSSREALWFSMDTSRDIAIDLGIGDARYRFILTGSVRDPCALLRLDRETAVRLGLPEGRSYSCLSLNRVYIYSGEAVNTLFVDKGRILESHALKTLADLLGGVALIDTRALTRLRSIERSCWRMVAAKRLDKRIVEVLREEFEPDAEGLTYIPMGSEYVLSLQLSKTSVRIDDLGDGAKMSVVTGLMLLAYRPRVILLEDPESHMHPTGLASYLGFVLRLAKDMGSQVIVSSHSIELVRIARRLCRDLGLELSIHFIERSSDGELRSRRLSSIDSEVLEKLGLDPRFLYVI